MKNNNLDEYEYLLKQYYTLKKMKKKLSKIQSKSINELTPLDIENAIYIFDNRQLTEKEKILYEIKRIKKYDTKNSLKYINNELLDKIYELNDKEIIINYKKEILKTEINLGMTVGLYSVTNLLMSDLGEKIKKMGLNNERIK